MLVLLLDLQFALITLPKLCDEGKGIDKGSHTLYAHQIIARRRMDIIQSSRTSLDNTRREEKTKVKRKIFFTVHQKWTLRETMFHCGDWRFWFHTWDLSAHSKLAGQTLPTGLPNSTGGVQVVVSKVGINCPGLEPHRPALVSTRLLLRENGLVVFKQSLHSNTLRLHICELPLNVHWTHDRWCKDHSEVKRSHLSVG